MRGESEGLGLGRSVCAAFAYLKPIAPARCVEKRAGRQELLELLTGMLLSAPKFADMIGYLPFKKSE